MPRLSVRAPHARRGYTVVELLAVMVILGVLGSVITSVMISQQRFFHRTNEQMAIRRELRTAMSVLPTDLRGMSTVGGDLIDFDNSSLSFRNVIGFAVACARPSNVALDIPPLNASKTTLTNWYTPPLVGDSLYVVRTDSSGVTGDFWSAHRITAIGTSTLLCAGSPLLSLLGDVGKTRYRLTVSPALPDSVVAGSVMRFVRSTRYQLSQQASGKWYLGRSEYLDGAWSSATAVAGPYMAPTSGGTGGIGLKFYDSTGVQVTTVADSRKVARVDLVVRAQGASSSGGFSTLAVKDTVAFRVALRNRQ